MATFNGEKYIKQQVDSILIQLGNEDEIIISDDYSTDNTIQIVKEINDVRIKIIMNTSKRGVTNNFENALMFTKGDFIFLADQDDIWLPNKVSICCKALEENDLVVSNCIVVDKDSNLVHPSYFEIANSQKGFFKNLFRSSYLGCCIAFRKEILHKILPIPKSLLLFHDWWFGFISDFCFKVRFIEDPCIYYRRHEGTSSNTLSKSNLSLSNKVIFRVQLLYLGLIRVIKIKMKL